MSQRILVVDDSPFIRRILSDWIKSEPDMELVGTANDGADAIAKAKSLSPDLITMDVEMPGTDGLTALAEIMKTCPTAVLMVSSLTQVGADATIKALELGAYDFVGKPTGSTSIKIVSSREEVMKKIRSGAKVKVSGAVTHPPKPTALRSAATDKVVLIASSTGGPKALASLWHMLPQGFNAPILIVQHMPPGFTDSFAKRLNAIGTVPCREAKAGDKVMPGVALLAPGGFHMKVDHGHIVLNEDPNVHGTRPAADPLFFSAVKEYGSRLVAAILTGMGRDGAEGALAVRQAGGRVFGQCEDSCTIYGMPKAAKSIGAVHGEFSIENMAEAILSGLHGEVKRAS